METADETADGDGAGTQAQEQAAQEDQGEVGKNNVKLKEKYYIAALKYHRIKACKVKVGW